MGTLEDWPDHNIINDGWTFVGKKKCPAYSYLTALYKSTQTVTTTLFNRILQDIFYNKKNKKTYIN